MGGQIKIIVVGGASAENTRLVQDLRLERFDVHPSTDPPNVSSSAEGGATAVRTEAADLVVINAADRLDVPDDVRACRMHWPEYTTPLLVLNQPDPDAAAAAIEAGATDAVPDATHGPMLTAHVRRMLRVGESGRARFDAERLRLQRESLAAATAAVAAPLGHLIDQMEASMRHTPADRILDEMLDRVGQVVEAVERLGRLAEAAEAEAADEPNVGPSPGPV